MNTRCIEEKRTCHVARIHTRTLSAESLRRRRRVAGWSRPRRGDEILESRRVDERERQVLAVNKLSDLGVQLLAVGGVEGVGDWRLRTVLLFLLVLDLRLLLRGRVYLSLHMRRNREGILKNER